MPDQLFPPLDTLPTPDQSMEDTLATMAREMLRLNPRLMLMLFIAPMDMVLVLDLSTEDTPPTPDQSMEDTPATMERERLRLNPRLRLMLFTAPMDMVLDLSTEDTLPTLDQSMVDTPEVSMDSTKPAFYQKENQRH